MRFGQRYILFYALLSHNVDETQGRKIGRPFDDDLFLMFGEYTMVVPTQLHGEGEASPPLKATIWGGAAPPSPRFLSVLSRLRG